MSPWPNDDLKSKIAFFGDPRKSDFQAKNLITIIPPFQMYYDNHPLKGINVNRKIAASLLRVFNNILEQCGHDQKKIDALGVSVYGGCYNLRPIRGSVKDKKRTTESAGSNLSNHAFAAAIDLDPNRNVLGAKIGKMSPLVVNAFKKENWLWGGDYKTRKDWMHFEAVSR